MSTKHNNYRLPDTAIVLTFNTELKYLNNETWKKSLHVAAVGLYTNNETTFSIIIKPTCRHKFPVSIYLQNKLTLNTTGHSI